jgi:hypothetical protein
LQFCQPGVKPTAARECSVGPDIDHLPAINHHDPVTLCAVASQWVITRVVRLCISPSSA